MSQEEWTVLMNLTYGQQYTQVCAHTEIYWSTHFPKWNATSCKKDAIARKLQPFVVDQSINDVSLVDRHHQSLDLTWDQDKSHYNVTVSLKRK
jgi:hypothetical protein